jgi:hypothetical protein
VAATLTGVAAAGVPAGAVAAVPVGVELEEVPAVGLAGLDCVPMDSQPIKPNETTSAARSARRGIRTPFEIIEQARLSFRSQMATKTQGNFDLPTG